jgi:transcription-repair coupling factor (superfamily II helicase)
VGYDLYVQMVSEAVSELKGEPRPQPIELSIDVPDAAHLPPAYVPAEDARLEAYRRLAAVRTHEEVDDVAAEWQDRFGPLPGSAHALLDVARLRVECLRLGITDLAVSGPRPGAQRSALGGDAPPATVKISPIDLPASAEVRLKRLVPGARLQSDLHRLLIPVPVPDEGGGYAPSLVSLLQELVPATG